MSISPARKAAFDVLLRIERERAFSSVLLPLYEDKLSRADRALCHELVLGTLRRQIKLDRLLDPFMGSKKLDLEVRIALRLAMYQLLFLSKVPARAAINDSVELVKRAKKSSASGFVNAILRRASSGHDTDLKYVDDVDRIATATSHPRWLVERWAAEIGVDEADKLATANNEPPKVAFRVIGAESEKLDELLASAIRSESVPDCYLVERSSPLLRKLAVENRVYLQDEASQMVAHAVELSEGGSFLDVCAAPGGKTGLVVARTLPALAVAGDVYQQRVELLRANCRRQGADVVEVVRHNAERALPFAGNSFDAVLVDAPCSGTGTIRHNPEIRYSLRPEDIAELSLKQRRILTEASNAVKKGGLLVYSTCSLEPEEGEAVAEWFAGQMPSFEPVAPRVPARFLTMAAFARTWPHRDGMDGFFIAAFRRV